MIHKASEVTAIHAPRSAACITTGKGNHLVRGSQVGSQGPWLGSEGLAVNPVNTSDICSHTSQ